MTMDKRKLLDPGTVLPFAGMECRVETLAGRGSNAIAYWGSWLGHRQPEGRHDVLIEELFPYHPQNAVYREESDKIGWSGEMENWMELHQLNFYREKQIQSSQNTSIKPMRQNSQRNQGGQRNQNNQNNQSSQGSLDSQSTHVLENTKPGMAVFFLNNTLYAVWELTAGRSLEMELARTEVADTEGMALTMHIRRISGVLNELEIFHRSGLLHLDISPDTIFLTGEGEKEQVILLNWNGFHTRRELEAGDLVYSRAKGCYTAPELRLGDAKNIGYAADLYSVAAIFYQCLTGKTLSMLQTVQNRVPDISGAGSLDGMSVPVCVMTRRILRRGLSCLTRGRYKSVAEMRRDLEELQARVDGKGFPPTWNMEEQSGGNILQESANGFAKIDSAREIKPL